MNLRQDLSYAVRMAARNPGFTAAAIVTLALGIGAATVTFSVADAIVFRPLPYADAHRLVKIWGSTAVAPVDNMSLADFHDISARSAIFEQVAGDDGTGFRIEDGQALHFADGAIVTEQWLSTLGVRPVLGRGFLRDEFQPGRDDVVILTDAYWRRRFGADGNIVGRSLRVDGRPLTIVGVLPPNVLRYGADFLKPLVPSSYPPGRDQRDLDVFARLRPGVTLAAAQAELDVLGRQIEAASPSANVNHRFRIIALDKYYASIDPSAGRGLVLMLGAVGLVLLIACVNVANLLLARNATRTRECVIRAALGASRTRLARQLLIENLLLFLAGGALGCFIAWWALDFVVALAVAGGYVPDRISVMLDGRVLAFSLVVSLTTGLIFGLAPAWQASKVDLNNGLKDSSQTARGGPRSGRTRRVLIVAELTISVVLLVGVGLVTRSLLGLYGNTDGFVPERLLETGSDAGREFEPAIKRWQLALEHARAVPGVEWAAVSSRPPVHGGRQQTFAVDGRAALAPGQEPRAGDILISADYFSTMGMRIVRGRAFTERDGGGSTRVVIISETLSRQVFPGEDPLGRRIRLDERAPMACCAAAGPVENVWREIVGVAADIRQANLDEVPAATIYRPFTQIVEHDMFLMVRTRTDRDVARVASLLPGALRSVDPTMDWWDVRPMHQVIAESGAIRGRRFVARLLGGFATLALVLAGVGLYGVMAYFVVERRREIAVRVALGATRAIVLEQVLGEAVRLLAIGLVTGAVAAQFLTRLIASLLFGVGATDVPTHLVVFAVLGTVTVLASYLPARRAASIDPIAALRE
ncbi:MAG TPA: ABC transporter permease [Vicinamibacterales bacterium]|nr:ABC transporter permease [Vicinamibacterales bacterium]